jgi:hypothetical protein
MVKPLSVIRESKTGVAKAQITLNDSLITDNSVWLMNSITHERNS